jgi:hypothetical protein
MGVIFTPLINLWAPELNILESGETIETRMVYPDIDKALLLF